jgi:hypothetical protein
MMTKAERGAQDSRLAETLAKRRGREMLIPQATDLTPEDRWFRALMEGVPGYKPPRRRRYDVGGFNGCSPPLPPDAPLSIPKPSKTEYIRDRMPFEEPKGCGCTRCGCWRPFSVSLAVGGSCHCERAPEPELILDNLPHCEDCGNLLTPPKHRGRKRGVLCQQCRKTANQAIYRERHKLCPAPKPVLVTLSKSRATMPLEACRA